MAFKKIPEKFKINSKKELEEKNFLSSELENDKTQYEQGMEKIGEKQGGVREREGEVGQEKIGESSSGLAISQSIQNHEKEQLKNIEKVLEEDLEDIYIKMDSSYQRKFKEKGEETARKINNLLKKTKVKVKKIVFLIKKWLLIIPGINKFFVEQEAKIKADKIIEIKNDKYYE